MTNQSGITEEELNALLTSPTTPDNVELNIQPYTKLPLFSQKTQFRQGGQGTCVLLSVLNSIITNPYNSDPNKYEYLNSLVNYVGNDEFIVHYGGLEDKKVKVSLEEVKGMNGATGSLGVAVLEAAFQKVVRTEDISPNVFLTGQPQEFTQSNLVLENMQSDPAYDHEHLFSVGLGSEDIGLPAGRTATLPDGSVVNLNEREILGADNQPFYLPANHSYTMWINTNQEGEYVVVIENPWDSRRIAELTLDEFSSIFKEYAVFPKTLPYRINNSVSVDIGNYGKINQFGDTEIGYYTSADQGSFVFFNAAVDSELNEKYGYDPVYHPGFDITLARYDTANIVIRNNDKIVCMFSYDKNLLGQLASENILPTDYIGLVITKAVKLHQGESLYPWELDQIKQEALGELSNENNPRKGWNGLSTIEYSSENYIETYQLLGLTMNRLIVMRTPQNETEMNKALDQINDLHLKFNKNPLPNEELKPIAEHLYNDIVENAPSQLHGMEKEEIHRPARKREARNIN